MLRSKTLIGLSLILLIVQSASCAWQPNNLKTEPLCKSEECTERGNLYKANMGDEGKPCEDFYTFTCGNWLKSHRGPKYPADRSVLDVIISDFNKIIRDVLESHKDNKSAPVLYQKAKDVYDICVKIPEYPRAVEASEISREIKKIGRLPKTRLWDIHTKYLKLTGESAFFRTAVIGESLQGDPVLIIMEPVSAYGSIKHVITWKPQEKQAYTDFLFKIIKSLNLPGTDAEIKQRIEKVFDFRRKFDEIIQRNIRIRPQLLNPLTAQELDKWFSDILEDQTNTQDIPWIEAMGALYHKMPVPMRHPRKLISLRQQQYFVDLMDLLENQSEEDLAFHMEIYFIERHLKLNDEMYKLLEGTTVESRTHLRYIRERFYQRWETCINNHNMQKTLEEMLYVNEKWNPKERHAMIEHLITRMKRKIYKLMNNAKWVDLSTLSTTLDKLNEIEPWIGFPPWVTGVGNGVDNRRVRDTKDILKPNAMLNMSGRWLYITAPLLLSPVFSMTIPAIYNYAGIGTTIGHELYHVIGDCGSYFNGNGNTVWWSRAIRRLCIRKMESFVSAYNKITNTVFLNHYDVVVNSSTSRTVQENLPDVMGLEAAYGLYKDATSKHKSGCETLPNFEKYSCDQMFYIAFANTYCAHNSKELALHKLATWDHSIESVRINGAVAQMDSFGTAFNCPIGSPMNPREKVNLWK